MNYLTVKSGIIAVVACFALLLSACTTTQKQFSESGLPIPVDKPDLPERYAYYDDGSSFEENENLLVSSADLSEIRGAFTADSGMIIDIGISTSAFVDGILLEQTEFNTSDLGAIDPSILQTLVQVNDNGTSSRKLGLEDVPLVLTVIQNSLDNVDIVSTTDLDIRVSNASNFALQSLVPVLNHQSLIAGR